MCQETILLADNQALTNEGLKSIVGSIDCYGIASFAATKFELFELLHQASPSIIIIDPDQVKDFTTSNLKELTNVFPVSKIMVLTSNANKDFILTVLSFGITHFVLKTCSKDEFLNALIGITNNENYLCKHAIEMLLSKNSSSNVSNEKENALTKKEIEITRLVALGLSTKSIATRSFLSVHTVNTHRRNILKKLGFSNTSELVLYALKSGIAETIEYHI